MREKPTLSQSGYHKYERTAAAAGLQAATQAENAGQKAPWWLSHAW